MLDYFACPNCGAEVPSKARACPECGSDENTGWSEETMYDDLGLS
ncbi:MAG: zinc-ribbon domain-containing protein, partial [Deltaproteobacteria bacterium]|nr:zinc-ribbon domain-containing protein [Deltaproteobacteria bacterium]